MHVLYIHRNFPAQFGHIGRELVARRGWRVTFLNEKCEGLYGGIQCIKYPEIHEDRTSSTGRLVRDYTEYVARSKAVFNELKARPNLQPDLVVAHSGFGNTLFIPELYDVPIVHFCEWFYRQYESDTDFFGDLYGNNSGALSRSRNAMLLADLENCTAGYSPTSWQKSRIPDEYQNKIETIFDGIDTAFWKPRPAPVDRTVAGHKLPDGKKVITYVSRGFETVRGFDIFMRIAQQICRERSDVVFLCIGSDRVCYGGDLARIKEKSFREHVLNRGRFDLNRFVFTGMVPPVELSKAFAISDLHLYLTVPFILSWSVMDALATGCTVLASDTPPLREVIVHGVNGYLAPFWDVDSFVKQALEILESPQAHRQNVGRNAVELIRRRYSLEHVLPKMQRLYERAVGGGTATTNHALGIHGSQSRAGRRLKSAEVTNWGLRSHRVPHVTPEKPLPKAVVWPNERPSTAGNAASTPSVKIECLKALIPVEPALILEVGSWTGETTVGMAETFRSSRVIAVDEWCGTELCRGAHAHWKASMVHIWDHFVARCWDIRHRTIALKQPHDLAIRYLYESGIKPDVIVVWPDYNTQSLRMLMEALSSCYPAVPWIGRGWHWPRMKAIVTKASEDDGRQLTVRDGFWLLEPPRTSGGSCCKEIRACV